MIENSFEETNFDKVLAHLEEKESLYSQKYFTDPQWENTAYSGRTLKR